MIARKYQITWICSDITPEQTMEITALNESAAVRNATTVLQVLENRTDVQVTGVSAV